MMIKDIYDELKTCEFKPITFGIYNKLQDDYFVGRLNSEYNDVFTIDDFEYFDFELNKNELLLLKDKDTDTIAWIKLLRKKLKPFKEVEMYVYADNGFIRVVKLKIFNSFV